MGHESSATKEHILADCAAARALAPETFPADLPATESGAPDWYRFEHEAWAIGEQVRHCLLRQPQLKRDAAVQRAIVDVIHCGNLRRGRQSFVMLLGYKAAQEWAPVIASYLDDPDVCGHTLDTLLKMRVPGYAVQVEPLLASKYTWIRNLARKYRERYP
jgi:hypothetical protein